MIAFVTTRCLYRSEPRIPESTDFPTISQQLLLHDLVVAHLPPSCSLTTLFPFHWDLRLLWAAAITCNPARSLGGFSQHEAEDTQ